MVKMSSRDASRNAVERYRRLAINAEASGYPETAFRSSLRAKELLPKNHLAEFEYAVKAAGLGQFREAILSCKKAIELNPGFKPAHKQLQLLFQM